MSFSTPLPISLAATIRQMPKGTDQFFAGAKLGTVKMIFVRIRRESPGKRYRRKVTKGGVHVWRVR